MVASRIRRLAACLMQTVPSGFDLIKQTSWIYMMGMNGSSTRRKIEGRERVTVQDPCCNVL
jgi:hypothetical protein